MMEEARARLDQTRHSLNLIIAALLVTWIGLASVVLQINHVAQDRRSDNQRLERRMDVVIQQLERGTK